MAEEGEDMVVVGEAGLGHDGDVAMDRRKNLSFRVFSDGAGGAWKSNPVCVRKYVFRSL